MFETIRPVCPILPHTSHASLYTLDLLLNFFAYVFLLCALLKKIHTQNNESKNKFEHQIKRDATDHNF